MVVTFAAWHVLTVLEGAGAVLYALPHTELHFPTVKIRITIQMANVHHRILVSAHQNEQNCLKRGPFLFCLLIQQIPEEGLPSRSWGQEGSEPGDQ